MATKKEIKELLKTISVTEKDMDAFWNDLIETNWKVKSLNNAGKTWRDLNASVIKELPTQKQKDLEAANIKKAEDEAKALAEQKAKEEKEYYWNHFDEIMVKKIDSGEKLTESELKTLVFECEEVEREYGENRRWTRGVSSIIELEGRLFCVNWENGLTESQDNEFYEQPYEVESKTYEKTITVTEWVKK